MVLCLYFIATIRPSYRRYCQWLACIFRWPAWDTTERPEALEAGTVKLVGTGYNSIIDNVSDLLENKDLYRQMSKAQNPYGDGKTSQSIVNILL